MKKVIGVVISQLFLFGGCGWASPIACPPAPSATQAQVINQATKGLML